MELEIALAVLIGVVYVLAVMRIVRLINGDTILDPLRLIPATKAHASRKRMNELKRAGQNDTAAIFETRSRRWSTLLYFIECPWCVGMWVCLASAWVPLYHWDNPFVQYIGIALAASHLIGVFAFAADTEEVTVEERQA